MTVTDTDMGFDAAIEGLLELDDVEITVGIVDERVAQYAIVQEAEHGFIRDTIDARGADIEAELSAVQRAAVAGDASDAIEKMGTETAEAIRGRIEELGLVKTGAMRDSVTSGVSHG